MIAESPLILPESIYTSVSDHRHFFRVNFFFKNVLVIAFSFFVGGGDTNGKGAIMVGSLNNPGPTFNRGEDGVFSTIVLIVGMTWACVLGSV